MILRPKALPALFLSLAWTANGLAAAEGFRMDFLWKTDRKEERLSLLRRGPYIRIDQPAALFSLIYNTELQSFLGLEHLDAHFWSFDWPTIHANAEKNRENGWRLRSDPFPEDPTLIPFTPSTSSPPPRAPVFHDLARFTWVRDPGPEGRWTGRAKEAEEAVVITFPMNGDCRALWLSTVQELKVLSQIFHFLLGREAWPESALAVWLSFPEDSGMPRDISWRKTGGEAGSLRLIAEQWTDPPSSLFTAPKDYQREDLEEIEGFLPQ
ncbi:conserved exported protein of unknown function [Methylacidimicrobium sp. AP8]|uniref:hypothetical protein n=1 Tax=Methylacidimicrobium sp. AP8 TaxID=2730359 RepID=UPI0018C0D95A|nr:hypothetical protein [Methylacidimicrobium sp. AP8]CAB4242553.1 conserved exported protein of unknown function [Methylacidimicrobium sp. AP8]